MDFPPVYYQIADALDRHFPALRPAQRRGLALWVWGLLLARRGTETAVAVALSAWGGSVSTLRQRLREWLYDGADKAAPCATQVEADACFAPLAAWVLSGWRGKEVPLAVDATAHGDRLVALVVSVLYRGSALPLAWAILPARGEGPWLEPIEALLARLAPALPPGKRVLVLADRGLWSPRLWHAIRRLGLHPLLRVQKTVLFQPHGGKKGPAARLIEGPGRAWVGRGKAFKERRLEATLVVLWVARAKEPCLVLTDLPPGEAPAGGYGLRFWIELGFRCLKSVGWDWEKTRRADPQRAARHWLAMAVATWWVIAAGSEGEVQEGPHEARPPAEGAADPPLRTPPNKARRRVSLFRRGMALLQRQLCEGALRLPAPLVPEPWPDLSPHIRIHTYQPPLC